MPVAHSHRPYLRMYLLVSHVFFVAAAVVVTAAYVCVCVRSYIDCLHQHQQRPNMNRELQISFRQLAMLEQTAVCCVSLSLSPRSPYVCVCVRVCVCFICTL